jgi:hypothetical protein
MPKAKVIVTRQGHQQYKVAWRARKVPALTSSGKQLSNSKSHTSVVYLIAMAETQSYKELLAKWADKYRGVSRAKPVYTTRLRSNLPCVGDRGRSRSPGSPVDTINLAHLQRSYDSL